MLAPLTETEPAELVLTLLASHMHTSLVLLDETLALWTRLGIGLDPSQVLAITLLFFPYFNHGTSCWQVVLIFTRKAERVPAFAVHDIFERVNSFFCHVVAAFLRAPLDVLVLIGHLLTMPVQIFLLVDNIMLEVLQEKAVRHYNVAPQLRTFCENTAWTIRGHFVNQKMFPTHFVELMAATQLI